MEDEIRLSQDFQKKAEQHRLLYTLKMYHFLPNTVYFAYKFLISFNRSQDQNYSKNVQKIATVAPSVERFPLKVNRHQFIKGKH